MKKNQPKERPLVIRHKQTTSSKKKDTMHKIPPDLPRLWISAVTRPNMGILFRPQWLGAVSGASVNVYKKFNPNSIWLPEVGGTGGTTPGYADWASFYGFYRVIEYHYKIQIVNKEAFNVNVWVNNANNEPGSSANSTIASNAKTFEKILSAKGGMDRITFTGGYTIAQIVGEDTVYTADTYRSLIGANPLDITWLTIGVQSYAGNLTNGVDVEISLSQKTVMYDYLTQTPSPEQVVQIKAHQKWCRQQIELRKPQTYVSAEPVAMLPGIL